MRHRRVGRKLHRERDQREALMRSLARSLVMKESIITTEAKAKAVRPYVERLVSKSKSATLAGHRVVAGEIGPDAARKLKNDIVPKFSGRAGGYTRITKRGARKTDSARMATIAFVA